MLAGTYSLAVVPDLQGATALVPKASRPITVRLLGMFMDVKPEQE